MKIPEKERPRVITWRDEDKDPLILEVAGPICVITVEESVGPASNCSMFGATPDQVREIAEALLRFANTGRL